MYIFNDVLDAFKQAGVTAIGSQYELPNPYTLEENPDYLLDKGWGVVVGDATVAPLDEFKLMSTEHVFSLVFTVSMIKTEFDSGTLITALKELYTMERDTRNILLQPNVSGISQAQVDFSLTSAPSFLSPDAEGGVSATSDYVSIISNYSVRIPEPLT